MDKLREAGYKVLKYLRPSNIELAICLSPAQRMRQEADKMEQKEADIAEFERLLGLPAAPVSKENTHE